MIMNDGKDYVRYWYPSKSFKCILCSDPLGTSCRNLNDFPNTVRIQAIIYPGKDVENYAVDAPDDDPAAKLAFVVIIGMHSFCIYSDGKRVCSESHYIC